MLSLADLKLRAMIEDDLIMVLTWRNSEHVRRFSLNDNIISLEEHKNWFYNLSDKTTAEWLIAEYEGKPIGVVSITDINSNDGTCTWGMYVGESTGILGIGVLMEIQVIDRIFEYHGIRKLWGKALESNRIVLTHKKFGFEEEGVLKNHIYRNGVFEDVILVALFAEQWAIRRKKILALFNLTDG